MNIIYLRVSKEDLDESTQLPEILKAFPNLKKYKILREKISAYKEDAQKNRSEFIKLKDMISNNEVKNVYVYSLERLERNIIRLFEFYFFCEANGCRIHGALQPSLELEFEENPTGTFSRYQQVLIFGLLGENESYMTSKRTKKSVRKKNGITMSKDGNKWGGQIRALPEHSKYYLKNGNGYARLDEDDIAELHKYIKRLLKTNSRTRVLEIIKEKKYLILSHAYISRNIK